MVSQENKLVITAIDKSDLLSRLAGLFNDNALIVSDVCDMVDRIISKMNAHGGKNSIYRLNIIGHGDSGIQGIGGGKNTESGKYLNTATLNQYRDILVRLRPYFRKDAIVTLHGCKVASGQSGRMFLTNFSTILGVPVEAGETNQYVFSGIEGPVTRCSPISLGSPNVPNCRNISENGGGSW